jgi:hypothetical protein
MLNAKIEHREKKLSSKFPSEVPNETIETQTQKIPNLVFMGLAGVSIAGSIFAAFRAGKKTDFANFIGHWAPTFLMLGLYNKIVKVESELLEHQHYSRDTQH